MVLCCVRRKLAHAYRQRDGKHASHWEGHGCDFRQDLNHRFRRLCVCRQRQLRILLYDTSMAPNTISLHRKMKSWFAWWKVYRCTHLRLGCLWIKLNNRKLQQHQKTCIAQEKHGHRDPCCEICDQCLHDDRLYDLRQKIHKRHNTKLTWRATQYYWVPLHTSRQHMQLYNLQKKMYAASIGLSTKLIVKMFMTAMPTPACRCETVREHAISNEQQIEK